MNTVKVQPDPAKQEESIKLGFEIFWDGIKTGNAISGEQTDEV
jgi:hypothetical protein